MLENIRFYCDECETSFIARPQEYIVSFWHGEIVKEAFCPVCGKMVKITSNSGGTGGEKF